MNTTIIGTGNLGSSIAKGLISSDQADTLYLTKRTVGKLQDYNEFQQVVVTTDNVHSVENSEIIILTVQPRHLESVLKEIAPALTDKHLIISGVAGYSISKIEEFIGVNQAIIRAMPNIAIAVGKSMTCLCANAKANDKILLAERIFKELGHTLIIPEEQMQAATVVCASGIAFWMRLIRATTQAAIQLGFEAKEAQELALFTSHGATSLLINSGRHPEEEIDKVTTPKGCTIEGLNEMEHKGLSSSLIQGMVASFSKISTLGNLED